MIILINDQFQSIRKCKDALIHTHKYLQLKIMLKKMLSIINVWKLSFILSIAALSSISFH